ncbi:MAG: hypothetical protein JSV56_08310 [Methanomassiliicoccales archaeon]|nr:MAG: hypothetical protein JSV56_08310 [Methanomassiliicoccales archaeon]
MNITGLGIFDLLVVDPLDMDHSDGKEYYLNISGFSVGIHSFYFAANDSIGDWDESGVLQFEVVNRDPVLFTGQVDPTTGFEDTWFNFTVSYTDPDNHAPGIITVNITGVGVYGILEVDPLDSDYIDGKGYYYNMSGFAIGSYDFYFAANDSIGVWTESGLLQFSVVNRAPIFSLEQVNPDLGYTDSVYNFTVIYTDSDNHIPNVALVNITGIGVYGLLEVDPLDTDYTDGKEYYLELSGFAPGSFSFYFAANDSIGDWTESGTLQFVVVNRDPILSNDKVSPSLGYIDTWFNFTVTYTDLDNHAPDVRTVNISGLGVYSLIEADPLDVDFTDGKEYYYNMSGFSLGTYSFNFAANDTIGNWSLSGILQFDVVNRIPVLSMEQVSPADGNIDTMFNFTVTYSDLDNHAPDVITVNISGVGVFDLLELDSLDTDSTDGKDYYLNVSGFIVGQYLFHFAANDTVGNWTESGILSFDIINRNPTLSSGQVSPGSGYFDSWFNFTVIYTDLDNHAPDIITVNITNLGIVTLNEVDSQDTDYTDGKLYYCNISDFDVGSYSFHFATNDTLGQWAQDSEEISGPYVDPIAGSLDAIDSTGEYSNDLVLVAILLDDISDPIVGENVSFYIDINKNGIYEEEELIGEGTSQLDGRASVIYPAFLTPNTYNFKANYVGSVSYVVGFDEALLTIYPESATLTATIIVAEVGVTVSLSATLLDDKGDPIEDENVAFYMDRNRNGIYEGGEFIVMSPTSAEGVASISYYIDLNPENYGIWAKYEGSSNYVVNEITGLLTVQNTTNNPPSIIGNVPDQIKPEDSLPWALDLTPYEDDLEDSGLNLEWYLTGVDNTLYSVTGMNSSDDIFTFIPQENAYGSDRVTIWLVDSSGDRVSQEMWVNITPVNDHPFFNPLPPNLDVHYDDPVASDDDPSPWDYTFYVHDIETPIEGLFLTTSEPTVDSGDGYAEVNGLEVTYHYPKHRLGDRIFITMTLSDGTNSTQTIIAVNITSNWVPKLVKKLPDIILEENTTRYNVFDLDEYFMDRDNDSLFFTSGHFHIKVHINEDNTVDITAVGQWTGSEFVTFRALDPIGAIAEDTIIVTVIPVNDGPEISGAPDLVVHYDYSYAFDFSPYIYDPDNSFSELVLWTSESTDYIRIQESNNVGILVNYPESMNGLTIPIIVYVSDGLSSASYQINITVSNDFPPELLSPLPDVFFDEDTVLENTFTLGDYFYDVDDDVLFYTYGNKFIDITINEDLTVDFSAPENWYGSEMVTFRATDPYGALTEDKILVVVVPVNDAPTISNISRQEMKEGDQWILDLSQFIDDIDTDLSNLIITVESEAGSGYVTLVGTILIFRYEEGIHEDMVTITVSDGELETSRSFIVNIERDKYIAPSIWDLIPWHWVFTILIIAIGGAFSIYRRKSKYVVYEVFLIHEIGLPISHVSREEISDLEEMVVSGMFTAVQNFINDIFSDNKSNDDWELDEMKFGEHKILIERAPNLYLAVIFEGYARKLRSRVRKLMLEIDDKYGAVLEDWDGDISRLKGLRVMTMSLIPERAGKDVGPTVLPAQTQIKVQTVESEDVLMDEEEQEEVIVDNASDESHEYSEGIKEPRPEEPRLKKFEGPECPVCGKEIDREYSQCPRCGVEFAVIRYSPSGFSHKGKKCPVCGTTVGKDEAQCSVCGGSSGDDDKIVSYECPMCGDNVEATAKSCPKCKVKFEA